MIARVATVSLAAALVSGAASAQDGKAGTVELWLSDAPLSRVLEQVAGKDGVHVVVGEGVDQRISGRLDGQRETVLATLAVEHGLGVHAAGNTVWFDSKSRPVVSLLRLPPDDTERARAALDPILEEGSVVQDTDEGLIVSGSRAFVEDARERVATLAPESEPAPDPSLATTGTGTPAAATPAEAGEPEVRPTREVRSVWDIPGYDVDYAAESAS